MQVLVLTTFLLAYVGHDGDLPVLGTELDHLWLGHGCLVAWLVILPSSVLGLVLGDGTAWRTVSIEYCSHAECSTLYYRSQFQIEDHDVADVSSLMS